VALVIDECGSIAIWMCVIDWKLAEFNIVRETREVFESFVQSFWAEALGISLEAFQHVSQMNSRTFRSAQVGWRRTTEMCNEGSVTKHEINALALQRARMTTGNQQE
jgi:hypothetical protein